MEINDGKGGLIGNIRTNFTENEIDHRADIHILLFQDPWMKWKSKDELMHNEIHHRNDVNMIQDPRHKKLNMGVYLQVYLQ